MELVTQPGLVFIEDPCYDLTAHDALHVARVISSLAQGNRTIICSLEKPIGSVVEVFQEVMIIGSGLLLYAGPTATVGEYFDNIGKEAGLAS